MHAPALGQQVHGGGRILDLNTVVDEHFYTVSALLHGASDVQKCPVAHQRAGADPERSVEECHALMREELRVGRRCRRAFQRGRRIRHGGIGGLRHGNPLIAGCFHHRDQPQRVVRGDQAVGIDGDDIVGGRHMPTGPGTLTGQQIQAVIPAGFGKTAADQAYIAIDVHRLVRRVRQVHIGFALEAAEFHPQQRPQPPNLTRQPRRTRRAAAQSRGVQAVLLRRRVQDTVAEQLVGMCRGGQIRPEPPRQIVQPVGNRAVQRRQKLRLGKPRLCRVA